MLDELQERIYEALIECDSEEIVNYFIQYHGTQLLTDGFKEHLISEGVMEEDEDEEEEEY